MTQSELYCGKPQGFWDNLLFQAEDLLREKELGVHLVGAYTIQLGECGGSPADAPGIFCLYIDSVESLINPGMLKDHLNKPCYVHGSVAVADLFSWVAWVIHCTRHGYDLKAHTIPLRNTILHEDDSLSEILSIVSELDNAQTDEQTDELIDKLGQSVADLYRSLV